MTNFEYYRYHVIPTVFRHFFSTFRIWKDLMTGNYENYELLESDDGFTECYNWFWFDINDDDTEPKEFLEYLNALMDRIDRGEEKIISLDENFFKRIDKLLSEGDEDERA